MDIRNQLMKLTEEDYQKFSSKLLPNIDNILGVRLPAIRKIAKEIAKGDWREYIENAKDDYFEEIMLQGMVIGNVPCDVDERLLLIGNFVPKIDNWSVCDSFCNGLKFTLKNKEEVWQFLKSYYNSTEEYELRFAVVMLLNYYIDNKNINKVLEILDHIDHGGYYVKMAVAWAVSACYIKLPDVTELYLKENNLDKFTYNKALQKITESYRVDKDTKKVIRSMKRK